MTLDVAAIRAAYPALADGYAYLDGAAGTQVPGSVIDATSLKVVATIPADQAFTPIDKSTCPLLKK
jgi:selenocysteine lyase/cysteine desulfurase